MKVFAYWSLRIVLIALIQSGCATVPESQTQRTISSANGTPVVAGRHAASVAVVLIDVGLCSGSLIHPRVVVTAAHCLQTLIVPNEIAVVVGNNANDIKLKRNLFGRRKTKTVENGRTIYLASKGIVHPNFAARFRSGQNDVGIIILHDPVEGVEPDIVTGPEQLLSQVSVQPGSVYGHLISFGKPNSGTKYEVFEPIQAITSQGSSERTTRGARDGYERVTTFGFNGESNFRPGDSGGPLYVESDGSKEKLLAIVSQGNSQNQPTEAYFTVLSDYICWIQRASGYPIAGAEMHCHEDLISLPASTSQAPDFVGLCRNPASLMQRHTFDVLRQLHGESDCEKLYESLREIRSLKIPALSVYDLTPLTDLNQLEELEVSGTRVHHVTPLLNLKNLRHLKFPNSVIDLDAFWELTNAKWDMTNFETYRRR